MPKTITVAWSNLEIFARDQTFKNLQGTVGVYVIFSAESFWKYITKCSDIAYVGSGDTGARLAAHASGNGDLQIYKILLNHKLKGHTVNVVYAELDNTVIAQCVEDDILLAFNDRYGSYPIANDNRPGCKSTTTLKLRYSYDVISQHDCTDEQ